MFFLGVNTDWIWASPLRIQNNDEYLYDNIIKLLFMRKGFKKPKKVLSVDWRPDRSIAKLVDLTIRTQAFRQEIPTTILWHNVNQLTTCDLRAYNKLSYLRHSHRGINLFIRGRDGSVKMYISAFAKANGLVIKRLSVKARDSQRYQNEVHNCHLRFDACHRSCYG